MRNAVEESLNPLRGPGVFLHTSVGASRGLVGESVLDDVDVAAVPIAQQDPETLLLVDLDGRDKQSPERIG